MGAAPKGQIYIDQATFRAASSNSRLSFTELAPIMVKGKSYPIPVYRPSPDLVNVLQYVLSFPPCLSQIR